MCLLIMTIVLYLMAVLTARYIILHNKGKFTLGKQEDFQIKCKL